MAGSLLSAVITILVFAAHLVFSLHDNKIFGKLFNCFASSPSFQMLSSSREFRSVNR